MKALLVYYTLLELFPSTVLRSRRSHDVFFLYISPLSAFFTWYTLAMIGDSVLTIQNTKIIISLIIRHICHISFTLYTVNVSKFFFTISLTVKVYFQSQSHFKILYCTCIWFCNLVFTISLIENVYFQSRPLLKILDRKHFDYL